MKYYYTVKSELMAFGGFCNTKEDMTNMLENNIFKFLLEDLVIYNGIYFTVIDCDTDDIITIIAEGKISERGLKHFFNEKDVKKILVKLNLLGYD